MIKTERMRDIHDNWVTEYRGQFNYAIPANQEVQSFIYDYDNDHYYAYPHPSARVPNGNFNDMPPHPTGFVGNNGQYYDESGNPYYPPPPPSPPRKRMSYKKSTATSEAKNKGKGKASNINNNKNNKVNDKKQVAFNNVTVPDSPKFHTSKTANRHMLNCANPYAPVTIKPTQKERKPVAKVERRPSTEIAEETESGSRLYHPLNYVGRRFPGPKARAAAPVPYPQPMLPTYSPFSTQEGLSSNPKFNVREVEPSPHGPVISSYSPPPAPPVPQVREATPSPRGFPSTSHPLPPPPAPPVPQVRETTPSPRGPIPPPKPASLASNPIPSRSITFPPTPPPKPSLAWEVPASPQGPISNAPASSIPAPPPPPPQHESDAIDPELHRTIVPPPAFSRNPQDKTTIPAHTCTHRWRNDSELYWANLPYRESPQLECAMCFASPHPNQYTKSFDPDRWLELNPKFYKYMPAQSMRKIPPAGKVVHRSPGFSISSMYHQ